MRVNRKLKRVLWTATVVPVAMMIAACGGDDEGTEQAAETIAPNGETVEVLSLDNNFIEQELTVSAGTEVKWVNNGRNDHNVLPDGDPEASKWGVLVDGFHPGDTYSHVFTEPGIYTYYCSIHGTADAGMYGTITVTEP